MLIVPGSVLPLESSVFRHFDPKWERQFACNKEHPLLWASNAQFNDDGNLTVDVDFYLRPGTFTPSQCSSFLFSKPSLATSLLPPNTLTTSKHKNAIP